MSRRLLVRLTATIVLLLGGELLASAVSSTNDLVQGHGAVVVARGVQAGDATQVVTGRTLLGINLGSFVWIVIGILLLILWLPYLFGLAKRGAMAATLLVSVVLILLLSACGSPAGSTKTRQVQIGASETAFIVNASIPADQQQLQAASFVQEKAILTGQIPITYEYYTASATKNCTVNCNQYTWKANNFVYLLDRAPITREWTNTATSGTSASNQAFSLKSVDGIAYSVEMNCTAKVSELDSAQFLSIYGGTGRVAVPPSKQDGDTFKDVPDAVFLVGAIGPVMDNNVRGEFQGRLSAAFGSLSLNDAFKQFGAIVTKTVADVTADFKGNGLTLQNCGAVGGPQPSNPAVQDALNNVSIANAQAQAQAITNQKNVDQAKADASVKKAAQDQELAYIKTLNDEIRGNPEIAQYLAAQKWNGVSPQTVVGSGSTPPFIQIGTPVAK